MVDPCAASRAQGRSHCQKRTSQQNGQFESMDRNLSVHTHALVIPHRSIECCIVPSTYKRQLAIILLMSFIGLRTKPSNFTVWLPLPQEDLSELEIDIICKFLEAGSNHVRLMKGRKSVNGSSAQGKNNCLQVQKCTKHNRGTK